MFPDFGKQCPFDRHMFDKKYTYEITHWPWVALNSGSSPAIVNTPATGYYVTISDVKIHIAVLYFQYIQLLNMDIDEAKSNIRNF